MANDTTLYTLYPELATDARGRFFDGQFLTAQDFVDEQRYHIDRLRRALDHLTSSGVADGLEVSAAGPWRIRVGSGVALDEHGRLLVLTAAIELADVPKDIPGGVVDVALRYDELESRVQGGSSEEEGTRGATRLRELPALEFHAPGAPPPRPLVALARLQLTADGGITVVTPNPVRRSAGLRLPGSGPSAPVLRSGAPARPGLVGLTGDLQVSGRLGVGTADPEAELDVRGVARLGQLSLREHGFRIAGDEASFYPIVFRDLDWGAGASVLELVRPNAHADVANAGALMACLRWHAGDGHGAELLECEVIQTRRFIAHVKLLKQDRLLVVWLRGARSYAWRAQQRCELVDDRALAKTLGGEQLDPRTTIEPALDRDRVRLGLGLDRQELRGSLTISGDLAYTGALSRLDVAENASVTLRAHDLFLGHSTRRGQPGRALVDHGGALNLNFAADWPLTRIGSHTEVQGNLTAHGDALLKKDAQVSNNLGVGGDLNITGDVTFKKGLAVTTNLGVGGDLSVTGGATFKRGASFGESVLVSRNEEHMRLSRPKHADGGPRLFLELVQLDGNTPEAYPAIRFHHENHFWHRLEARKSGLHVRDGSLGSDDYKNLHAGDIYANSLHVATGPAERLRIVRGTVTASGSIADGAGFNPTQQTGWLTKITFNSPFASTPSVVVTQQFPDNNDATAGGDPRDNATVVRVDRYAAYIKCGTNSGEGAWRRFHFVAVGP